MCQRDAPEHNRQHSLKNPRDIRARDKRLKFGLLQYMMMNEDSWNFSR